MAALRRAHRDPVHRIAQHRGQFARVEPRCRPRARRSAQVLDERGQRAAVCAAPTALSPHSASPAAASAIEQVGERRVLAAATSGASMRLDLGPPRRRRRASARDRRAAAPAPAPGAGRAAPARSARAASSQPRAALARRDQRMVEQREQRHRRGAARPATSASSSSSRPAAVCGSGAAGGIVGLDVPARADARPPARPGRGRA